MRRKISTRRRLTRYLTAHLLGLATISASGAASDGGSASRVILDDGEYTLFAATRYSYGVENEYRHSADRPDGDMRRVLVSELWMDASPATAAMQRAAEITSEYSALARIVVPKSGIARVRTHDVEGQELATLVYLSGGWDHYAVHAVRFSPHPSLLGLMLLEWSETCPRVEGDLDAAGRCIDIFRDRSQQLVERVLPAHVPLLDPQDVPELNYGVGWPETNWGIVTDPVPPEWTHPASGPIRLMATHTNVGWVLSFVFDRPVVEVEYRVRGRKQYKRHPGPTKLSIVDKTIELEVRYREDDAPWLGPVIVPFDPDAHRKIAERRATQSPG
ncbi:MAG: hypothetical protein MPN21_21490 [Thermoanaerobaculia bacterium]|nr:hypothetical protein [Thermoanaerobaculia bacterium]